MPRSAPHLVLLVAATAVAFACARPTVTDRAPAAAAPAPADSLDLVIASTTDVHGWLRGWNYYDNAPDSTRGLTRAATIVDSVRGANPGRVILVDAGDLLQGNPLAYVAARITGDSVSPIVAAMNAMRYDASAIGNHEFNYGVDYLNAAVAHARFPFLSANTVLPSGARAYRGWTIVERAGVRIGIVGATTPGVMVWDRENVRGRIEVRDIVASVRAAVAEVRAAGATVVVLTMHSGLGGPSSYDTLSAHVPAENVAERVARDVGGIDLIVFGHTHREVADTVIGTTMLVQPRNWATSVSLVHLGLHRDNGLWRVRTHRGAIVRAVGHAESPRLLEVTAPAHQATVAYVTAPIGSTPVAWRGDSARVADTPLLDFVLEVERRATGADLATTAAFALDARLDSGVVTAAQLARLYPYDNTLRAIRVSGRQVRDYLEYSARYYRTLGGDSAIVDASIPGYNYDVLAGADYSIDLTQPPGGRVTRLMVNGRAVMPADSFTMALNNYRQTGGGGYAMLRDAPVVYDRQQEIRQLLIDEVRRRRVILPADYFTRNYVLEPRSAVEQAYRAMHGAAPVRDAGERAVAARTPPGTQRYLRVIATNDFHGALAPRRDSTGARRGGGAYLAAAIGAAASECAPRCVTILLDGGDLFQGTPASNLAYGRPVLELYRHLGYAGAALGNHEFDWGQDTLRARIREAGFRIMGANVRDSLGRDVAWIPDDTIVVRAGIRIGLIGIATPNTPNDSKPANVAGLRFDDPVPVIDARTRALRGRGARFVIVLAHSGAFCSRTRTPACTGEIVSMAARITEHVDAIVSGHTHSSVSTRVNGIPIVQAMSSGRAIGIIDLPFDENTGWTAIPDVRAVRSDSIVPAPGAARIVQRAVAAVSATVDRPVATLAFDMRRSGGDQTLGNLVTDAQRWAARATVAVINRSGIRADADSGRATYGSLFEIQPFDNRLVRVRVTGAQLQAYFERMAAGGMPRLFASGVTARYDTLRPPGARLVSLAFADGRAIVPGASYSLAMTDYMVTADDYRPPEGAGVEPLALTDLESLVRYLRAQPQPVTAPREARLQAITP